VADASKIYADFLRLCPLYPRHIEHLRDHRHYSDDEIGRLGFGSTPEPIDAPAIVDKLVEIHGQDDVLKVPGFNLGHEVYLDDGRPIPRQVRFSAPKGILLPQLGWNGKVESVVVRLDEPNQDGARYLPLTIDGKATITTGIHCPAGARDILRVRVAEGIHKANTATLRTGVYTIGMPDSGWWTPAFAFLQEHAPTATIVVCPDADVKKHQPVCLTLVSALHKLAATGASWELEAWKSDKDDQPKGIDDLLNANGTPKLITGVLRWALLRGWLRDFSASDPRVDARITLDGITEKVKLDVTAAFKPGIPEALAHLDLGSVEAQAIMIPLQRLLQRAGWKEFKRRLDVQVEKNKQADAKAKTEERIAIADASGTRILNRGDQAEAALALLDDITANGRQERAYQRCVYADGELYLYDGSIFSKQPHDELVTKVAAYAGQPVGTQGKLLSVSETFTRGAVKLAYSNRSQPEFFAKAPHGVAFEDKFLMVKNGTVEAVSHSIEHGARFAFPFEYKADLVPKRFLTAMQRWFHDKSDKDEYIACVQEHIGACIFGIAPRYARALVLRGDGGDGKSRLGMIYEGVLPPGSVSSIAPQDMHREYDRAALAGALLNVCYELPENDMMDASPFKAVVVGDKLKARQPYRPVYWIVPRAGHLLICNALFKTKDFTRAFTRRWIILDFTAPIGTVEGDVDNPTLAEDILHEERAAIISWAIEGAKRLLKNGEYTVPQASHDAVAEWMGESNTVAQYADERLVVLKAVDGKGTAGPTIYDDYKFWIKEVNPSSTPLSRDRFLRRLRSWLQTKGVDKQHCNDGNYYPVRLRGSDGGPQSGHGDDGFDLADMMEAV